MRNTHKTRNHHATILFAHLCASLLLVCSCATKPQPASATGQPARPAEVTMNENAGRGDHLFVTLHLESGEELPVFVDTGSPMTVLDKSLEPKLGTCLGPDTLWNFGTRYEGRRYPTPPLYLGHTRLITDCNAIASDYIAKTSSQMGRPVLGILGMDCLQHYCVQLDFRARKIRFLAPEQVKPARLGQAFPMVFSSAGQGDPNWFRLFIHHSSLAGGPEVDLLVDTGNNCDGTLETELFRRQVQEQRLRVPADGPQDKEPNSISLPECVWHGATYTSLWLSNGKDAIEGGSGESSLGLRFLARHLVTFDFPHRIMYLKQTRQAPLVDPELVAAGNAASKSVLRFVRKQMRTGQLPGWSRKDRGTGTYMYHFHRDPDTVTLDISKKGDSSTYHYEFTRPAQDSPWQLRKAWRTDKNDHTVEEYPVAPEAPKR